MAKVGAGLSVVSAGITAGLKANLDAADDLGKTAAKIGIPIEALGRLGYAADLSGVSMETLQTGVSRLSKNMVAFANGGEAAVTAFENVGVSATDASGNLKPTEQVIAELADAFAGMPDGAEKTAAAMALLGKGGAEMIPLLNGGAAALRSMGAEADRMGIVISEDTFKNAEIFNDNLTRLQATVAGVGTVMTAQLAPVLARISDFAVSIAAKFQSLSPEVQKFIGVAGGIGLVLGPVVLVLGTLAIGIGAIGAPILAAIAGITSLIAVFVAFQPEMEAVRQAVIDFGTQALDWIKAKPGEIAALFAALPAQFAQIGRDVFAGLVSGLTDKYEAVKSSITGFAGGLVSSVKGALGIQSPSTVFAEIGRNIMAGLAGGLDETKGEVKIGVEGFAQDIASTFAGILTGATTFKEGLSGILGRVGDSLLSAGIGGVGKGLGIPGFARGTNFAPGGLAMVGERGPELVNLPRGARVTPNNRLGGMSIVRVDLGPGLVGSILSQAGADADVRISQATPAIVGESVKASGKAMAGNRHVGRPVR